MKPSYSLDDLRCFCAVAKFRSFKDAAVSLGMPLSTLSRRIRQLEEDLELRLLNRDAHRVSLTHTGEKYFKRSSSLFDELNDIDQDLHSEKHQPKGKIRITAPFYAGKQFLRSIFYDFLLEYPDIQLDLRFSNTLIDIDAEGIDLAFRMGNPRVEEWVVRPLKHTHNILCCPPDFPSDKITHPEKLSYYASVVGSSLLPWQLSNSSTREEFVYHPQQLVRLEVDEISMMTAAVKAGLGISYLPNYLVSPMIERGEIKHLLPEWQSNPRMLSMLYRDRNNMPLRVRLLIDYVLKRFEAAG